MIRLIVLAAGLSTRMGSRDKLVQKVGDRTMLEHAVAAAVHAAVGDVIVVTGAHGYADVLHPLPVRQVENPDYEEGMAASIRAGVAAAGDAAAGDATAGDVTAGDVTAYGILLGDMPFIRAATIALLASSASSQSIVAPTFRDRIGHPILFGSRFRDDLLALRGDVGGRSILTAHADAVVRVEVDDEGVLRDIDTEDGLGLASA